MRDTRRVKSVSLAVVLALSLGCGCGSSGTPPVKSSPLTATADDPSCPLLVPGTSIAVEDAPGGTALVFVTTGDVAAVRTRGARLATMHNAHDGAPSALGMMFSKGSTATASDLEGGVRVTFAPADPASAGALADELRMHGHHLTGATSCEMH